MGVGDATFCPTRWSFGILLWELYTFGIQPYAGLANHEIAGHIRAGHRLEQPEACPDEVFAIMEACWSKSPQNRPDFGQLAATLKQYADGSQSQWSPVPWGGGSDGTPFTVTLSAPFGMEFGGGMSDGYFVEKVQVGGNGAGVPKVKMGLSILAINGERTTGRGKKAFSALLKANKSNCIFTLQDDPNTFAQYVARKNRKGGKRMTTSGPSLKDPEPTANGRTRPANADLEAELAGPGPTAGPLHQFDTKPRSPPQPHVQQELCAAVKNGDIGVVRKLLEDDGADPSVPGPDDPLRPPVYLAAVRGDLGLGVMKVMLEHNANPNAAKVANGYSLLGAAVVVGNVPMLRLLLAYNADPNQATLKEGQTPIYIAAHLGRMEMVKVLLAHSADANLVEAGNGRTSSNWTLAGLTTMFWWNSDPDGDPDGDPDDVAYEPGTSPLLVAANAGHDEVVRLLLMFKAEPNHARAADGATSLCLAAEQGFLSVAEALLEFHAEPNQGRTTDGCTPVHIAVQNGHVELLKVLLQNNADPNLGKTDTGATPLGTATFNGNFTAAKLLLQHGADPNQARTDSGASPLCIAAQEGHFEIAKMLLEHNADIQQPRADGVSPVQIATGVATFEYRREIADLFQRHIDCATYVANRVIEPS